MMRGVGAKVLAAVLATGFLCGTSSAQQWREHSLLLKVGAKAWTYDNDQLKAMATAQHTSNRGTKKNPAIPLALLLTKDTQLSMDRILGVAFVGKDHVLFLEGEHLKHLEHLLLKFGTNHMSLVPETEDTYKALKPMMGKPRLESVERIQVFERR